MIVKVSIPHTFLDSYDYLANDLELVIGARVWVPFRNQIKLGFVVEIDVTAQKAIKLKNISSVIDDVPIISEPILFLCRWISSYYQAPLGDVIALALPKNIRKGSPLKLPVTDYYKLNFNRDDPPIFQRAKLKQQLISFLVAYGQDLVPKKVLLQEGFKTTQIKGLMENGLITKVQEDSLPEVNNKAKNNPLVLNEEQELAVKTIINALDLYNCFLLQGVTGSGKTEVYLQVLAEVLAVDKQVLVIVPEIGLTPQLLQRFCERFSVPIAVIHSDLNDKEREQAFIWAAKEHVKLVIGTRSAIFTPMPKLGLIVIDEEHDSSLKQMEGVRYSARDTALVRAHRANIPIILGSATPSLESLYNCNLKKYILLRLNQKAMNSSPLHYQLVDLRNQTLENGFANVTLNLIGEHLAQNNQVLVFINRRGFSPVFMCHQCGFILDCSACDSHLTFHRETNKLICHHCGLIKPVVYQCQSCHGRELIPIGFGTQRVYDYLSSKFPTTAILRIDRDSVQKKQALNEHLDKINTGKVQLIIGTQMLAKGHHFPRLTLVVVLDADSGFYNQDFRAIERLGQLLTQVSGRAGRAEFSGQVVIQTHLPQEPLLNLLIKEGYDPFAKELLSLRHQAVLPPYNFLAMIRAQDKNQIKVKNFMSKIKEHLKGSSLVVMGPAPAPLTRKAGEFRMQLLLKSNSRKKLGDAICAMREWLIASKLGQNLRFNIDVDPMDLS